MSVEIENGVPIPAQGKGRKSELAATLASLQVGQSFKQPYKQTIYTCVSSWAQRAAKGEKAFLVRKIDKDTVRIWRTK